MHIAGDEGSAPLLRCPEIDYSKLKREAVEHPKRRSRQILVPGFDMVICLTADSYIQMHRHPRYEAYHVIFGRLFVETEEGTTMHTPHGNPYVCIPACTWHRPWTDTQYVIYREFYCGPFEKSRDVEYHPKTMKEAA